MCVLKNYDFCLWFLETNMAQLIMFILFTKPKSKIEKSINYVVCVDQFLLFIIIIFILLVQMQSINFYSNSLSEKPKFDNILVPF
ncbi:hypothetical protein BpHYR1_011757 [Brachionus plicatilis]|uniref:Uncharacterized protein n=1 Tax=Brachionus plicatilis TaxID=10195 RepID=A0A3M7P8E6_BRAPC|nr:hypothetical protein BpHYR1_011757 [Brachionus plicatilis]